MKDSQHESKFPNNACTTVVLMLMPSSQELNSGLYIATCVDESPPGVLPAEPHHSQLLDLCNKKQMIMFAIGSLWRGWLETNDE